MNVLAGGLYATENYEDALTVQEAGLSIERRIGGSVRDMLSAQGNLAITYAKLGRREAAMRLRRDVYSGRLRLNGEDHEETLRAAHNYAVSLRDLSRYEETKSLLRKTIPIARRVLSENHKTTLTMRSVYAEALFCDSGATLDDLREAVTTLEDAERIGRRVFGGAHPTTALIERNLRAARAALRARENAATVDPD